MWQVVKHDGALIQLPSGGPQLTHQLVTAVTAVLAGHHAAQSGALVMFMHAGFAMLETGSCRAKNASNVLMKSLGLVVYPVIA